MWCMSGGAEHTIMLPNTCLMLPYLCCVCILMFEKFRAGLYMYIADMARPERSQLCSQKKCYYLVSVVPHIP